MVKISDLKSHPYSKTVFRELTGNEYEAFKESVKQHGIQVRIEITSDNIILCGHQRVRALKELYSKDYDLTDSKVWVRKDLEIKDNPEMTDILQRMRVIEDNELRRHLNDGEKTMIYTEKKKLEEVLAKNRERMGKEKIPDPQKGQSRDKAAEGLGKTGKTWENYKKMMDLATKEEKEYFLNTGKILDSLKKKYKEKKQEESRQRAEEANKKRKEKIKEEKQKKEKEESKKRKKAEEERKELEKKKKKELEEKIKQEKLKKEEAEKLRKEAEEKKKQEEEERKKIEEEQKIKEEEMSQRIKIHYQSSEKMKELDETIGLIITSPPYWKIKEYGQGESKWTYDEYLKTMKRVWKECFRVLKPSSKLCINIGDQYMGVKEHGKYEAIPIHADFIQQCKEIGFDYHGLIIWQKVKTLNASGGGVFLGSYPYPKNGLVLFDYEFILLFHKPGEVERPEKDIKESSALAQNEWVTYFTSPWIFPGEKQKDHPAQFPEELPKRLIKMFSFKDETVMDPFLGTATTIKVAKDLDRKGIGYEINEKEFKALIENKLNI